MSRASDPEPAYTERNVRLDRYVDSKYQAVVELADYFDARHGDGYQMRHMPRVVGRYDFVRVPSVVDMVDSVRGDVPETDGLAVFYVGSGPKHYWTSHSLDDVPVDVLEAVRDKGFALLSHVGGGWSNWGGRPEFSTKYVDFEDAEVVDLDALIAERRGDVEPPAPAAKVEFGTLDAANDWRDANADALHPDDDRRSRTVTVAGDAPVHVVENAEDAADE